MKWLLVAVIVAYCVVRVWAAVFPQSATARALSPSRRQTSGLATMSAARLLRSGAFFLLFAAGCGISFLGLRFASLDHGWAGLETPFFGALSGSLVAVGGLAALCGFFLLLWAAVKSVR